MKRIKDDHDRLSAYLWQEHGDQLCHSYRTVLRNTQWLRPDISMLRLELGRELLQGREIFTEYNDDT